MQGLLLILLIAFSSHTMSLSMSETINEAGRQRMLSQKIAKAYFMQGIKSNSTSAASQIKNGTYRFEYNLNMLKNSPQTANLKPLLVDIETLWLKYKKVIESPISKENADTVLDYSEKILKKSQTLVMKLEKIAGTKNAAIINISGQQRMLSQRITKNYLAASWGADSNNIQKEFTSDLELFSQNLQTLINNPTNTEKINTGLIKVKEKVNYINQVFKDNINLSNSKTMLIVTGTTNSILRQMDEITQLYVLLSQK